MTIHCPHWSPEKGGTCGIGLYRGRPSHGVCRACLAKHQPVELTIAQKAVSYARAEASRFISGKLPDDQRDARWLACSGRTWEGEEVRPPCPSFMPEPGRDDGWCRSCGCGERRSARLRRKAAMPKATCPIGVWAAD